VKSRFFQPFNGKRIDAHSGSKFNFFFPTPLSIFLSSLFTTLCYHDSAVHTTIAALQLAARLDLTSPYRHAEASSTYLAALRQAMFDCEELARSS